MTSQQRHHRWKDGKPAWRRVKRRSACHNAPLDTGHWWTVDTGHWTVWLQCPGDDVMTLTLSRPDVKLTSLWLAAMMGWGQQHIKAVISPKWCKIGPRLLLRTNRKSHTHFRLAPKSMTSDGLERPKRHSCRNKQNFWGLNSFIIKIRAKYSGRKREQN